MNEVWFSFDSAIFNYGSQKAAVEQSEATEFLKLYNIYYFYSSENSKRLIQIVGPMQWEGESFFPPTFVC